MKSLLSLSLSVFLLISCSGTKETVKKDYIVDYDTYENPYYQKKTKNSTASGNAYSNSYAYRQNHGSEASKDVVVSTKKMNITINKIIEEYTGHPISEIARSLIFETKHGYEWKFTNVNTGQSYKIETNKDFEDVQVKTLSSISDF